MHIINVSIICAATAFSPRLQSRKGLGALAWSRINDEKVRDGGGEGRGGGGGEELKQQQ